MVNKNPVQILKKIKNLMNRKFFILITAILLLLTACSSSSYLAIRNSFAEESGIEITETSYGPDALQNVTRYVKNGVQIDSSKAIVFIHGGGWQTGDKGIWHKHCLDLARTFNFEIYNINYRLGSIKNAVADCEDFVKQLRQKGKKIVVIGFSAGGYISLYLAEKNRVNGAVTYAAPTDLTGSNSTPILDSCIEKGKLKKEDLKKYSPVYLCKDSGSKVPIYMVQSTGDHLVSYYQALDYYISKKSTADIILKKAKGEHGFQFRMRSKQNKAIWEKGVKPFIKEVFNKN